MATNNEFIPQMGGTEYVRSRFIVLNDDRDALRYEYNGTLQKRFVEESSEAPVEIDDDTVGTATFVQGATAEEKREVARQAVMALMNGLDDDELVAELAYLFQYEDSGSTDTLLVNTPERFIAKLRESLKELRDGSNLGSGDLYASIPHGA